MVLCGRLLPLSTFSKLIHVVAPKSTPFLFTAKQYSVVCSTAVKGIYLDVGAGENFRD